MPLSPNNKDSLLSKTETMQPGLWPSDEHSYNLYMFVAQRKLSNDVRRIPFCERDSHSWAPNQKKSAEANFVKNLRVISEKMAFETEAYLPPSLACLKVGFSYVWFQMFCWHAGC